MSETPRIIVLSLTPEEEELVLKRRTPLEFLELQRQFVANFIVRDAELEAQEKYRAGIAADVAEVQAAFPSLWPVDEDGGAG